MVQYHVCTCFEVHQRDGLKIIKMIMRTVYISWHQNKNPFIQHELFHNNKVSGQKRLTDDYVECTNDLTALTIHVSVLLNNIVRCIFHM